MVRINPFRALRPDSKRAGELACPPYDVLNRKEARNLSQGRPHSFLHVSRADADFPDSVSPYDPKVYKKGRENLDHMQEEGLLIQDERPMLYIYRLIMDGRSQTGLVFTSPVDEYLNGNIKKHELTLEAKEKDRIRHFDACDANTAPIFLAYRENEEIQQLINDWISSHKPEADFISIESVRHTTWKIDDPELIQKLQSLFEEIPALYIADGHHRMASAAKTSLKRRSQHPDAPEDAEFNRFLAVAFPDEELKILAYNRVIKDLNGMSEKAFLKKLSENFIIEPLADEASSAPQKKGQFGLFMDQKWWKLDIKEDRVPDDPVESLDVALLQNLVLSPLLDIKDPRNSERIDFIGGIRGVEELEKRCQEDMAIAFSMYPTSIKELFQVADAGRIMPPKSTWFEPKLYSGLFVHLLT